MKFGNTAEILRATFSLHLQGSLLIEVGDKK